MINPKLRWGVWLALLAAVSGLVLSDHGRTPDTDIVAEVPQKMRGLEPNQAGARASAEPQQEPTILAIKPRKTATNITDSFAPHDWTPPPPPAKSLPPPPPTAPPLPFTVLGKKLEDGVWQVFLGRQDQVFVVKPHDMIGDTYRIDETRPPLMTFTYLPLNQRQTLPIGGVE